MRNLLCIVAAVSCWLGTPQAISACTCTGPIPTVPEALAGAHAVFMGTVIEIVEPAIEAEYDSVKIKIPLFSFTKFKVDRAWKGVDGEKTFVLAQRETSCKSVYELGEDYLIYARRQGPLLRPSFFSDFSVEEEILQLDIEEEFFQLDIKEEFLQLIEGASFHPDICSRGGRLSRATEDLEVLGEPSFTLVKPTVWGQIKALFY